MFRVGGQVLGGAVNLGLDVHRNHPGSVSYNVYLVFIALQAAGPFIGLLLTVPHKVERTDGITVSCSIPKEQSVLEELTATGKLFISKRWLLVIPLVAQSVFAEAVFFTFEGLWFSVRARALASFLSGIVAMIAGNVLGAFLDRTNWSERSRARYSFLILITLQGAWWVWGTIIVTQFHRSQPNYDWTDAGFGKGFAWFLFMVMSFQMNYMYLYFIIGHLSRNSAEIIRFAGLLRGTESASQAVSVCQLASAINKTQLLILSSVVWCREHQHYGPGRRCVSQFWSLGHLHHPGVVRDQGNWRQVQQVSKRER